jgi:hypothetical protein
MDRIYPVSVCAFIGLFGQVSPHEVQSWESIGFKGFLILVVVALAGYQLYRDRLDRNQAELRHLEIRTSLKEINDKLHDVDKTGSRMIDLEERQLRETQDLRSENSAVFDRQWSLLKRDKE